MSYHTSVSWSVRLWDLSWWVVGRHPACLLRLPLRLGSVANTSSVVSLTSGCWTLTRLGLRFSTRSVPIPIRLSAPIFVEGYFTVTLSSAPPLLSTPILCLSQCSAFIALEQAIPTQPSTLSCRYRRSPLSEPVVAPAQPVVAPTEPPWSPPPCTCVATCSPCTSLAVESQLPPIVTSPTPVFILDDPDKDVTWQLNHLTRENLRIMWHQRLGHVRSRRVSDMHKYAIGVPNLPIATEIDSVLSASRPSSTKLTSLPARLLSAIKVFLPCKIYRQGDVGECLMVQS
jgi:hypothetical protein